MKRSLVLLISVFITSSLFAQRQVSGLLKDSTGTPVIAASVKLTSVRDTLLARSDLNGKFIFNNVQSSQFLITVMSLGYQTLNRRYLYKEDTSPLALDPITVNIQSNLLNEVVVSGSKGVTVKQDTVEFRASDYPVRENSVVEDVLKKLPGVEVDKEGNVSSQGKSITRVKVNGKDFFNGDLKTATQQLPAEVIERIQIVDDYGDQANISGIREGDPEKIINITIRPDKNKGMIVNGVAGGGDQGRYQVSGMGQFMNNDQQTSVLLNLNNTNASIFNFDGGGRRGFGGGRGGFTPGGGGGNFGGNNNNGITNASSIGLNYRDDLSKKVSIFGSYSMRVRNTDLLGNSYSVANTNVGNLGNLETTSNSDSETDNSNHRFNFNLEYKIDTLNYLRISPSFSYAGSETDVFSNSFQRTDRSANSQIVNSYGKSKSPDVGGNIIFNHRFNRPGRNLSIAASYNQSDNKNDQDRNDDFEFYAEGSSIPTDSASHRLVSTDNESRYTNANITYSEPVGKLGRLDIGYTYSLSSYDNSRITKLYEDGTPVQNDRLSNIYDYSFATNRFNLNYRFDKQRLYNFNIGLTAQPTLLKGRSQTSGAPETNKSGFNLFPTARFSYNFARSKSLTINYNGRSTEPSFSQIQPVIDETDPQRPIVGNPNLKSAFNQSVNISYNNSDSQTGTYFNAGLFSTITSDQIVRNVRTYQVEIEPGKYNTIQETGYLNADGYNNTNAYYSWSRPFADRKYTLRLGGFVSNTNDVSFVDGEKNTGKNWSLSQNLRWTINPNQNIEVYPAASYRYSWVNYGLPNYNDTKASTWSLDLGGKVYFLKTFIVGFDLSKNLNTGYTGTTNANPFIVNTYLEKQFLNKRGTFRIQGFDLLNEGTNISRSVSGNMTTNSETNRLTRYFMATLSIRLQKFAGNSQQKFDNDREMMRQRRNEGGGMRPPGGF